MFIIAGRRFTALDRHLGLLDHATAATAATARWWSSKAARPAVCAPGLSPDRRGAFKTGRHTHTHTHVATHTHGCASAPVCLFYGRRLFRTC